jgi:hypothetical protein
MTLALLLAASPWVLGFASSLSATLSACAIAALLALTAFADYRLREWADEASLTVGAWSLVAPFAIGFAEPSPALWTHLAAGAAALIIGVAASDWRAGRPPRLMA